MIIKIKNKKVSIILSIFSFFVVLCIFFYLKNITNKNCLLHINYKNPLDVKICINSNPNVKINALDIYDHQKDIFWEDIPLAVAIEKSDNLSLIDEIIKRGANVNERDSFGKTILMRAINKNNLTLIKLLLKYGAYINVKDRFGEGILLNAFPQYYDDSTITPEILKLLINNGANVHEKDSEGNNVLIRAIKSTQYPEIIDILIEAGLNINEKNKKGIQLALSHAVLNGNISIIKKVLASNFNIKKNDSAGFSNLDWAFIDASLSTNFEIFDFFLNSPYLNLSKKNKYGLKLKEYAFLEALRKVDSFSLNKNDTENRHKIFYKLFELVKENKKLLNYALREANSKESIDFLINNGADVNYQDIDGVTALMIASSNQNWATINQLLKNGANPNLRAKKNASTSIRKRKFDIIQFDPDISYETTNVSNWTALDFLLNTKIDTDIADYIKDKKFNDIEKEEIQHAIQRNRMHLFKCLLLLLHNGASKFDKKTFLTALSLGNDIVYEFIKKDEKLLYVPLDDGLYALHFAVIYKDFELIKLLSNKRTVNIKDKNLNLTPIQWAKELKLPKEVVTYLQNINK
ncbi:MAG: ankyrin repeat domain-containing protein [Alphaproteobacteria bacterium]|nr:ankyrin repeat domain-containing protein [Alphaproteobacteria bacterium]